MENTTTSMINGENDLCNPSNETINELYNLNLHIASVFIILAVSFLGASISVVSARVKRLRINPIIINVGKFFGSGVVLATGFIHMLPAAMGALSDECLPDSWLNYEAYAGLFAMLAALAMQLIEFIAHQHYHPREEQNKLISTDPNQTISVSQRGETVEIVRTPSDGHQHGLMFQDSSKQHKISTYLLEFGIALHSVLIGVALGTTIEEFEALLIALCFHQFFEGMALGAQIAGVKDMSTIAAIGMVLFFALTTPVGVAIGIGVHLRTYNPKSVAALLVNGIFDSVSAGILIYVALVNLINGDMGPHAKAFHQSKTRLKVLYFVALYLGVAAMSVIGRWA